MANEVYKDDANLQGLWSLEETSGNRADYTPNGNTLTDNNTVGSSTDAQEGSRSASFVAANTEYLSITDAAQTGLDITADITICGWFKPASINANQFLVGKYRTSDNQRSYRIILTSGNVLQAILSSAGTSTRTCTAGTTLSAGTWYHFAFVYDGTDIRVYLDGALDPATNNPVTHSAGIFNGSAEFTVGKQDGFSNPVDGLMDEVAVFDRALSADEIDSIYQFGIQDVPSPPTPPPTTVPFARYRPSYVAAEYAVWLATPDGQRLRLLTTSGPQADVTRLHSRRVLNAPGVATLTLRASDDYLDYIQVDSRLIIERRLPSGTVIDTDTFWWIRDWEETFDWGREFLEVTAYSALFSLGGRIVAYPSGSSEANKSGYLDDLMKAVVRENAGSLAAADRQIAGLVVAADQSVGPQTDGQALARLNILPVLRDLSSEAAQLGAAVYYDIEADFTFRTYVGQRGQDRSLDSDQPLRLSVDNGSLSKVRISTQTADERNYIYAGRQGEDEARVVATASDPDRLAASSYNRRELWLDARNTTEDEAGALAQAELNEQRFRETWEVEMMDTPAIRYGRDWEFGDRLMAEYKFRLREVMVTQVDLLLENGEDKISGKLEVV